MGSITSPELAQELFDVYLGQNCIVPSMRTAFHSGLRRLVRSEPR